MNIDKVDQAFMDNYSWLCIYDEDVLINFFVNIKFLNKLYVDTFDAVQNSVAPERVAMTYTDMKSGQLGIQSAFELPNGKTDKITVVARDTVDMVMNHPEVFESDDED